MNDKEKMKRYGFFIGLIILFGGLDLAILLSHLSRYFGFILIAVGLVIMLLTREKKSPETELEQEPVVRKRALKKWEKAGDNLGERFIHLLTFNGILKPYLPIFGILVLCTVIGFNLFIASEFLLGSNDYVVLLLAGALIAYNYVPSTYKVEKNFALIFMIFLFLILVIPTTTYTLACPVDPDSPTITNNSATRLLLTSPTVGLSMVFGMDFIDVSNNILIFHGPEGQTINLLIGLSCTGLYSVAIFVSAFIAFIFVEYNKFNKKTLWLLSLGILMAWFANIIRMTIIVLVGKYYGSQPMEWTHNNIGEIIFMIWVSLFWLLMFRYLGMWDDMSEKRGREKKNEAIPERDDRRPPSRQCQICETSLSHTIPSYRCGCGKIYHKECAVGVKHCPECHREMNID